jgi:hypothetical protein
MDPIEMPLFRPSYFASRIAKITAQLAAKSVHATETDIHRSSIASPHQISRSRFVARIGLGKSEGKVCSEAANNFSWNTTNFGCLKINRGYRNKPPPDLPPRRFVNSRNFDRLPALQEPKRI